MPAAQSLPPLQRAPRSRRPAVAVAAIVALGLGLAFASQLLLPSIARSRIADRLGSRVGSVRSLDIAATPAVKLLWGDADRVDVHLGTVDAATLRHDGQPRWVGVPELEAEVDELTTKLGDVSDIHLRKSGEAFAADLTIDPAQARGPLADALHPQVSSDGGLSLVLGDGTGDRGLRLQVAAVGSSIVARPDGAGLLGKLVGSRTLFVAPQVQFDDLHATSAGSRIHVRLTGRTVS